MSGAGWTRRRLLEAGALGAAASAFSPWLAGCAKQVAAPGGQAAPAMAQEVSGANSLKAHAAARGLTYGCAVVPYLLDRDEAYTRLVKEQAGILVAENSMKWAPMRPAIDRFNFEQADKLVAFAEANGMLVRGHNLCWHRQLPKWFEAEANKSNARELLTTHITTVAGRYAGKLQAWDVVNEAVFPPDGRKDGLRDSPWMRLIGPEYIELAFRTARAADSHALLTYNDYGIEAEDDASAKKRAAVLELVQGLKDRGVPLDAVGVQSHIEVGKAYGAGLTSFLAAVRGMGLQIFVTEMDVNDRELSSNDKLRDDEVAKLYREYLELVLRDPAVKTVLTWGITDRNTWLNGEDARKDHLPERCLPFDARLEPVEAFFGMRDAFDFVGSRM